MSKARAEEPKIQIDSEVTRCIRQHARLHSKTEVCGVLIGEKKGDFIQVQASIEALNAAQGGTHVTFTQEAWEEIYRVKDAKYPDDRIVGWYHSHPGFGVFLSEHDMFIQQNFFSSPDQVAWVYDPHTDEEGCFGWVGGEVHRLSSLHIADNNGDSVERTPKSVASAIEESDDEVMERPDVRTASTPRWMQWTVTVLGYAAALVLGFAVSYLFFPSILPVAVIQDPATNQVLFAPLSPERVPVSVLRRLLSGEQTVVQIPPGTNIQGSPLLAAPAQSAPAAAQPASPAPNSGGKR